MLVLPVDLAHKNYSDVGVVILDSSNATITCRLLLLRSSGLPSPLALAHELHAICVVEGIKLVLLDGPQGWKAADNGLDHSRQCERQLNTPGKTRLPWSTKPRTYLSFISFCVSTFDALCGMGWRRFEGLGTEQDGPTLIESFPYSAWQHLKLRPLPSKRRARRDDIDFGVQCLQSMFDLKIDAPPNHDQLQALVSGLAGLAVAERNFDICCFAGLPRRHVDGLWREGLIVNRKPV